MASLYKDTAKNFAIQFSVAGKRRTICLGGIALERDAKVVLTHVEELAAAVAEKRYPSEATRTWLGKQKPDFLARLKAAGLLDWRQELLLGAFITSYIAGRTDVKPATKEIWRQGEMGLVEYFKADKPLRDITPGDADNYKLFLIGKKLAPMTVRKRLQFAKTIFRAAFRLRLIDANPFEEVSGSAAMPDRKFSVTPEMTAAILEKCPDFDWRAIVALARYGGLRCPSEVLSLRLDDIDWENGRILVTSPKTEHHPGKASRVIPLFPELVPYLRESQEAAPDGAVYVVNEKYRKASNAAAGWRNCNLRTTFEKIIKRAGLTPWPRLFHNLRSSRQTELVRQHPSHVVCAWLGNSQEIADKHYLQVTEDDYTKATE